MPAGVRRGRRPGCTLRALRAIAALGMALLASASLVVAVDPAPNLSGTWLLDLARSDLGHRSGPGTAGDVNRRRRGGGMPRGGGFPGGGFPGGGGRRRGDPGGGGDSRRGRPPAAAGTILPLDLTLAIEASDSEVRVTRKFKADGEAREVVQRLPLDGTVATNPGALGQGEILSSAWFKKRKLVHEATQAASRSRIERQSKIKDEYSLSDDGRTLTLETKITGPGGEYRSKLVFHPPE